MASRLSQEEGDKFTTESKGGYAAEKVDRSLVVCDVNTPFRKACSDASSFGSSRLRVHANETIGKSRTLGKGRCNVTRTLGKGRCNVTRTLGKGRRDMTSTLGKGRPDVTRTSGKGRCDVTNTLSKGLCD